jgi:hypothetical protein
VGKDIIVLLAASRASGAGDPRGRHIERVIREYKELLGAENYYLEIKNQDA